MLLLPPAGCRPRPEEPRAARSGSWSGPGVAGSGTEGDEPYVRVIGGREVRGLDEASAIAGRSAAPKADPLEGIRLETVAFEDMTLGQVALMLTRMTGQNVVASAEAGGRRVSLYLRNVSARAAIEGVCRLNNLWYREDPEMIRLLTAGEYGRELVVKRDEQTRLYYLKNASAPAVADMIAALMPDQVAYIRPAEETSFGHVGTDGDDPMSRSNTSTETAAAYGDNYSGAPGAAGNRAVSRTNYGYSRSDVQSGYQQGLSAGKIEQLDKGAAQQGRGEVSTGALAEKTGAQVPVTISVFLRNNCVGVRAVQESLHREIGRMIEALDTPTRQVLLEVKVLKVALGDGFESFFDVAYNNNKDNPAIAVQQLGGASISDSTVSFTYLDSHIEATIKLLKSDDRLHSVATPMLLCANNASAEFFSGVTRMLVTNYDYETRYGENNVAVDIARPVVEEREIGTQVRIKPSINADGTVTLRFRLEVGSVNEKGASIYQVKGDELVALPIDTVDNEKVESIVVASHGQAVVMGGLITESVSKTRSRVPILGSIPVAGLLFRKQVDRTSRNETVVIIVPHIIGTAAQGSRESEGVARENATHPWVTRDQKNLTDWDEKRGKVRELDR
jgi:type II secretory pathway component GspD/PulD (secretin)